MSNKLTDRVAVVTGGGRGIGATIVKALSAEGASVVLVARTQNQIESVAGSIEADGGRALTVRADITDLDSAPAIVDAAVDHFGRVDILVNNVGGAMPGPFMDSNWQQLEEALRLNVLTTFELTRLFAPHLLYARGAVVNISSAYDRMPARGMAVYGTAKAAVSHLTRLIAADLAPKVRVNAISPGNIETEGMRTILTPELRSRIEDATPLRRVGRVEDVAAAAVWLASDDASFVTGKVLELNGGADAPTFPNDLPDL